MEKTTFKEAVTLTEARRDDLKYTEKVVKNKLDRLTVELSGNDSGVMTKLGARFDRLSKAVKKMAETRDEIQDQIKTKVTELFNAEDEVLTRVVETAQFTMTLAKLIKASEQEPKKVVDYESIARDLAALIPKELEEKVKEITALYTKTSIAVDKSPALRIVRKVDESLNEGVADVFKSLAATAIKWAKATAAWASGYDKQLAALKARAKAVK